MAFIGLFASSLATGAIFAIGTRLYGINHIGIIMGMAGIGIGLHMLVVILWYIATKRSAKP